MVVALETMSAGMEDRICISLPCDLHYRDGVGALIQHVCRRLERSGEDPVLGHQVVSAFNEAFNNIVAYAGPRTPPPVEVVLELTPACLTIELRDAGPPYDVESVADPDLEALPESGLGIFIMRSFMSEVAYTPGSDGAKNRLRMIRKLKGQATQNTAQGKDSHA